LFRREEELAAILAGVSCAAEEDGDAVDDDIAPAEPLDGGNGAVRHLVDEFDGPWPLDSDHVGIVGAIDHLDIRRRTGLEPR